MASGQKMLNTLFSGRRARRRSDAAPGAQDRVSSGWEDFGVGGGEGGSDWNCGGPEEVDQTAVWRSNSTGSSWPEGLVVVGACAGRDLGMGRSWGMVGRLEAWRAYCSARAEMHVVRVDSEMWKRSCRSSGEGCGAMRRWRRAAMLVSRWVREAERVVVQGAERLISTY
jgi:hypothetical protein